MYIYIYYDIFLSSSSNKKYFRQMCGENQNTRFMFHEVLTETRPFMR